MRTKVGMVTGRDCGEARLGSSRVTNFDAVMRWQHSEDSTDQVWYDQLSNHGGIPYRCEAHRTTFAVPGISISSQWFQILGAVGERPAWRAGDGQG